MNESGVSSSRKTEESRGGVLNTATGQTIGETTVDQVKPMVNTTFQNDAEERHERPFDVDMYNTKMLDGMDVYEKESVIQFLQTPVRIRSFNVTSAQTADTTIQSFNLPFDSGNAGSSANGTGQYMWLSRLNSYMGFKATAVLNIQVNCNRFAQGRLLCHYIPGQNTDPNDSQTHRWNLITKTQTPNVQLNLNRDTSTEFRVPFVSAYPFYDLTRNGGTLTMNTTYGQMGTMYIVVYSPLVGATSLPVNVWLHFEDIELFTPTFAPQGRTNTQDEENKLDGVLSKPLNAVSKAFGALREIPSLRSYAGMARWAANAAAKSAANWGFSKPDDESLVLRANINPHPYMSNSDAYVAGTKLGFSTTNKLDVLPGFAGNDIDEMSLEYVCNRPAWLNTFTWSTSDATDTQLYSFSLTPSNLVQTTTVNSRLVSAYTPAGFVSTFFGMWRWDWVFTIKVVKTEFHTGKLDVAFYAGTSSAPTALARPYLFREILDLKETDTFVIKIPFAARTPMLRCFDTMGNLSINVVNQLNAPPSVASSTSVLVEIATENVAFAGPGEVTHYVATGDGTPFTPQGLEAEQPREKVFVLGNSKSRPKTLTTARYVYGEEINSFKQILNKSSLFSMNNWTNTSVNAIAIRPFAAQGSYLQSSGPTWVDYPISGDHYSAISACYVLARGGVRLFIATSSQTDFLGSYGMNRNSTANGNIYGTSVNKPSYVHTESYVNRTVVGHSGLYTVPHYGYTPSRENVVKFATTTEWNLGEPEGFFYWDCYGGVVPQTGMRVYRSAADDLQLGFFIGVPTMYSAFGTRTY